MKKYLLFLIIFNVSTNEIISQNSESKQLKNHDKSPSGIRNDNGLYLFNTKEKVNTPARQKKTVKSQSEHVLKVTAATKFTSSINGFNILEKSSKPFCYNSKINILSFIHNKSQTYNASPFSNSGTIVGMTSNNFGVSWDSTCIWTNATQFGRFPQGGIYNPLGNTNKNNSYFVGCGPLNNGSGWIGNWYASKSINGNGTNSPGSDMQANLDAAPFIKKHAMSLYSFSTIEGGLCRSLANIVNDVNGTTASTYGLRGVAMVKGQFNVGAMVWSVDSFIPCVLTKSSGAKYLRNSCLQAWSEDGQVGYLIVLGVRCNATVCQSSYQPIVYKTTNSGSTWALIPGTSFNNSLIDNRISGTNINPNLKIPQFTSNEGWDAVVDYQGSLHLSCTILGSYSTHIDSLDYNLVYGLESYNHSYLGSFDYPTIYDFKLNNVGIWSAMIVDSMGTEGPSGNWGMPGFNQNPWVDGLGARVDLNSRIQLSRTDDGKKIFYSWTESDSLTVGLKWNIYPDIKMKSLDLVTNNITPRINVTSGVTNADQQSYFHFTCNRAIGNSTACVSLPFIVSNNTLNNASLPIQHFYVDGVSLCQSNYSVTSSGPGPINSFYQNFQNCSGVGINDKANIFDYSIVYPNPSEGLISISNSKEKIRNVYVTDNLGRQVFELPNQSNDNVMTIDMSNFSRGLYFLTIQLENSIETKKILLE